MTLVIYDNEGQIFSQVTGNYLLPKGGVQYLEIEIPQGKLLKSIDVTKKPHQAILEDIPKSDTELAKERINALEQSNAELMNLIMMQSITPTK